MFVKFVIETKYYRLFGWSKFHAKFLLLYRAKRAPANVHYRRHGLVSNFFEYRASHKADLATERERLLTTARANQTTGLTNGRAANWVPEVESSPFRALSRKRLKSCSALL